MNHGFGSPSFCAPINQGFGSRFIKVYIQDDPPRPSGPKNSRGPVDHAYSDDDEEPGYIEEDCLEVEGEADPLVILVVPEFYRVGIFERRRIELKDQE